MPLVGAGHEERQGMNRNSIITNTWSNLNSELLYASRWPEEPPLVAQCENGDQCGGCSFYAEFTSDWGLCCNPKSRHHLETIFEHFTCPACVPECWGPHSFTEDAEFHCRCCGEPSEYWDNLVRILRGEK